MESEMRSRTRNSRNELAAVGSSGMTFNNDGNATSDEQGNTLAYDPLESAEASDEQKRVRRWKREGVGIWNQDNAKSPGLPTRLLSGPCPCAAKHGLAFGSGAQARRVAM